MSRRRGGLSDEDRRLWSQVAAGTSPLTKSARKPLPASAKTPPKNTDAARRNAATGAVSGTAATDTFSISPFRIGQTAAAPSSTRVSLSPSPGQRLAEDPIRMDHKVHRRMTRGKLIPEAKLDLHGMTLAVAQPVLHDFVLRQHGAGRRLILVITGKGKPGGPDAPLPVRPGALRHFVPQWLNRPPLSPLILQVVRAHLKHGGEGAYYVYLRR